MRWRKLRLRGSLLSTYSIFSGGGGWEDEEGFGWGGRLFEAGRLLEVGANWRLGAYSNKYGNFNWYRNNAGRIFFSIFLFCLFL